MHNKKSISKVEEDILFYLVNKDNMLTCNHSFVIEDKLKRKYLANELIQASTNLEKKKLISFHNNQNGHILDHIALKEIKKLFPLKYRFVFIKKFISKTFTNLASLIRLLKP